MRLSHHAAIIDSCGHAAKAANIKYYKKQGIKSIPSRGALSALTVPGAVAGWKQAYDFSVNKLGGTLPLRRLLNDAEQTAKDGIAVTNTLKCIDNWNFKQIEIFSWHKHQSLIHEFFCFPTRISDHKDYDFNHLFYQTRHILISYSHQNPTFRTFM